MSKPLSNEIQPRESVRWFAENMEAKLRQNDHKGGWKRCCSFKYLLERCEEEAEELRDSIQFLRKYRNNQRDFPGDLVNECVDVANFAMMMADKVRKHLELDKKPDDFDYPQCMNCPLPDRHRDALRVLQGSNGCRSQENDDE